MSSDHIRITGLGPGGLLGSSGSSHLCLGSAFVCTNVSATNALPFTGILLSPSSWIAHAVNYIRPKQLALQRTP